ncbi:MAG: MFS transporter [Castellaniella sp.]|uniref:MFS transporter n=1 Tax=Castellaniella sp. TaxID=1955812 RepID=UPI002A365796|nr:MFS transporter [Castellaniella sp.]MDY0308287.1 MFS transporter [Castellaniella sp.]
MPIWPRRPAGKPSDPDTFSLIHIALPAFGPSLLFGLGEGAIFPVLALSARDLGASSAQAGLIVALIGIGSMAANVPAAMLANRYGERRAMVGAALFSLVALVLCLAAHTPWVFGLGVLMIGLASSVFMLARQTYLIEAVPPSMRARAMSTLGGTMRVGLFTGPFLAAGFIHLVGLSGAYWAAILAFLGTGILALTVPDLHPRDDAPAHGRPHSPLTRLAREHARVFLTLGISTALVAAIRSCRQIVIPLWADQIGLDATATALIYGIMGGVDMLLFYPAGRVMDLRGRLWVALPCMLIMGTSLIAIPWTTGFSSLLVVSTVLGMGNGIGSGIIMTIGADASPAADRTRFLGIWRLITDLGGGGGPLLLSAITAALSLASGITAIGALGFVAAWMFWRWLPRRIVPTSPGPVRPGPR